DDTERIIAPYGVVLHARKWYIPAYCYLRNDIRVFRMDRITEAVATEKHFTKPAHFDPRAHVAESIAHIPGTYTFEVLFDAPLETMKAIIVPTLMILEASESTTLVRCYSDDPFWFARYLVQVE